MTLEQPMDRIDCTKNLKELNMSNASMKITGFAHRMPQMLPEGDMAIIFKTMQPKKGENNQETFESLVRVRVKKQLWESVASEIIETTYYVIEGIPKASLSSKKIPFMSVFCSSIKVMNGLKKDVEAADGNVFLEKIPEDTDDIVALSDITVNEKQEISSKLENKAFNFYKQHNALWRSIVVNEETMTIVSGYENYLLCKDLGMDAVPVSYDTVVGPESKDEEFIKDLVWYSPEEVTKVELKSIILTEDVHLNVQNFLFRINLKKYSESGKMTTPIAIRPIGQGKYSLVTGAARYFAAKILDIPIIPAVITDMGHDEFIKNKTKL
jgi:hypothetical protein